MRKGEGTTDRWGLRVSESGEWGPSVGFNKRQGSLFLSPSLNELGSHRLALQVGFNEAQGLCTEFIHMFSSLMIFSSAKIMVCFA
jgi:hypothetical protein